MPHSQWGFREAKKHMISIIIPVYNQAEKLKSCLHSIIGQTYINYEIIVVNDGSTDNFTEIIGPYQKELGLKMEVINQENRGAAAARNRGARKAKGEFIIFCDADIIMLTHGMLRIMREALRANPQASYVYSSFKWGWKTFKSYPFSPELLKKRPYIHTTSLIKREHFPGFDENVKRLQDWDLWLSMLNKGYNGAWINRVLFKVRSGGTMSSWLPSFSYTWLPFLPKVKKYKAAVEIIRQKHRL